MWQIDNRSPFAVGREWIRDIDGREVWVVAVKATYDLLPGGVTRIAAEQPPVNSGLISADDGTPLYDTDLGPAKLATDIILLGHAYSPGTEPARELRVALRVGSLQREARIVGERHWQRGLLGHRPGTPEPFLLMPLGWTRSLGGDTLDAPNATGNPIGRGLELNGPLPNIEHPQAAFTSPDARPPTTGFGPIPRHWPWRQRFAGTYDEAWARERSPLQPADLDPRHWQIAPPEQQYPNHLRGGEEVELTHLAPVNIAPNGVLRFKLPRLSLGFETLFYDGTMIRSRSRIHTVILEPDHLRLSIVHHMALPCHPKVNLLERSIVTVKQRPLDPKDTSDPEPT